MSRPRSFAGLLWIVAVLGAVVFVVWTQTARVKRAQMVADAVPVELKTSTESATGYAQEMRRLVIPAPFYGSAEWIMQTQKMLHDGQIQMRRIDYANAPQGHEIIAASPYRWWLGTVAMVDHGVTGQPVGVAVEHAALYADPLLQVLLLLVVAALVRRVFGPMPAVIAAWGLAALFPLSTRFAAGLPDDATLGLGCALGSVLAIVAGLADASRTNRPNSKLRRWFGVSGICGGAGLWLDVTKQWPLLVGIGLGAVAGTYLMRRETPVEPGSRGSATLSSAPWMWWAMVGTATAMLGFAAESFPAHFGEWELRRMHPLYAVSWLGMGLVLAVLLPRLENMAVKWDRRTVALAAVGGVAGFALPLGMKVTGNAGFLTTDFASSRLGKIAEAPEAVSLFAWLGSGTAGALAWATLLPVVLIGPVGWMLARRIGRREQRLGLTVALGPVLVALGFGCGQLSWWSYFDVVLLVLVVAGAAGLSAVRLSRGVQWGAGAALVMVLLPGLLAGLPKRGKFVLETPELAGLIQRDFSHWLAKRAGVEDAVMLAPTSETIPFHYYGSLRGVATLSRDNEAGSEAMVRILSASSPQEARLLMENRRITRIALPSWDQSMEHYTLLGTPQLEGSFYGAMRNWSQPTWLRPVAYEMPTVAGFEGQSIVLFEVVDEQTDILALSRMASYFIEMDRVNYAAAIAQTLTQSTFDLGAWVTRAEVAASTGNQNEFGTCLGTLQSRLAAGGDRGLPWDRRLSLALVLTQAKAAEARIQAERCFAQINETRLRSMSTRALYRLLALGRIHNLTITDARLAALARELLPPEWRSRV
ncbi:hypothetical protein [Synoicihabitans lomoniglobus]|uniref:Uncharacterized protein n=1 Tax=Synoicihabitans lomoniglobus TaxID=2909285 RepID=A0AAE9ZQH9_9BACT|nr:hypothetical protein [Opitutaceae bacterium LMO-M01]WED63225.1 hypothetical protein PXH66_12885 [Opitutaceae bacterium LMO-M01]